MHSFQNFIVRLIPNHPPPLETRIWKLVVRALKPPPTLGLNREFMIINIPPYQSIVFSFILKKT